MNIPPLALEQLVFASFVANLDLPAESKFLVELTQLSHQAYLALQASSIMDTSEELGGEEIAKFDYSLSEDATSYIKLKHQRLRLRFKKNITRKRRLVEINTRRTKRSKKTSRLLQSCLDIGEVREDYVKIQIFSISTFVKTLAIRGSGMTYTKGQRSNQGNILRKDT